VALVDEMKHEDAGSDYFDGDAAAWFAGYQHQEYATIRLLAACDERGELVGIGNCTYENEGSTAFVSVAVAARHRGHGIEDALLAELEAMSREAGKSVAETYSFVGSARAGSEQLASPTGFGSVPREDHWTRFFLKHGYALGQVERASAFDLRAEPASVRRIDRKSTRLNSSHVKISY